MGKKCAEIFTLNNINYLSTVGNHGNFLIGKRTKRLSAGHLIKVAKSYMQSADFHKK